MADMGRRRRPYLPGVVFHLTARTLRREHRFSRPLRTKALDALANVAQHSQVSLLAVAVMSNHLHVVAQQGDRPLADLMHPLLRRLALRIQDVHGLDGPVFWRPYASQPCMDPWHLRNAIVYTHLNPVRAGLCDDPADYPWSSHALYTSPPAEAPGALAQLADVLDATIALPIFASGPRRSCEELRDDYRRFVLWRQQLDRVPDRDDLTVPNAPPDWNWPTGSANLSPLFQPKFPTRHGGQPDDSRPSAYIPDMAAIARATLAAEAPGVAIEAIRGRTGGARAARLRHAVIRRLHAAGFRNVDIARFIHLSESAISYVLRNPRTSGEAPVRPIT